LLALELKDGILQLDAEKIVQKLIHGTHLQQQEHYRGCKSAADAWRVVVDDDRPENPSLRPWTRRHRRYLLGRSVSLLLQDVVGP
jgi:hypothetical protein